MIVALVAQNATAQSARDEPTRRSSETKLTKIAKNGTMFGKESSDGNHERIAA
jgi:hypothetical protein